MDFLLLTGLFLAVFFIYTKVLVQKMRINNASHPAVVAFYFLSAVGILYVVYPPEVISFLNALFEKYSLLTLLTFYAVAGGLYWWVQHNINPPMAKINQNQNQLFLQLRYSFLFGKSFDILFQQICFYILLSIFMSAYGFDIALFGIFAGVVALAHILLFFIQGTFWAVFYSGFSFIGATLFALLIFFSPLGIVLSFCLHLGFYIVAGVVSWVWFGNRIKKQPA